jgi:hypothetical protein
VNSAAINMGVQVAMTFKRQGVNSKSQKSWEMV